MLLRVCLVRTDVSEERIDSIIRVERISELGKPSVVSSRIASDVVWLWYETSVLTRATRHIQEDGSVLRLLVTANAVPS
jgi:hypothetical protein